MAEERVQRRLAAIISADVVGYSKMMGLDEAGTLSRLKSLRAEFLHPNIARYGGRIVKTTGDGTLIEFGSAVDAVSYAVEVQRGMAERNADLPDDQQIRLRIGINVGDIIIDGDDIFGDGVNVAARIEALAEPGGICISARVCDYVRGRLDVRFEDLGPQTVKNIAEPVHVFRVMPDQTANGAGKADAASPPVNKPSIAVLPFDNMSDDPDQEYFSDGVTEDLITSLSRIHWFFVTARNSSFSYKGMSPDIRTVARELGVRYVLEGSVRKAGNRIRVTAQLIEGETGNHVWAERYDRKIEDVFDLQDEMTEKIVGAIEPAITRAEIQRSRAKRPDNLDAWDLCQKGHWHWGRNLHEDYVKAQEFYERAIEADPEFATAYAGLADSLAYETFFSASPDSAEKAERAVQLARRAVEIDAEDPHVHLSLGRASLVAGSFENAIAAYRKALQLNPYFAAAHYALGHALIIAGRFHEGIDAVHKAMELSPQDIRMGPFYSRLAQAYFCLKDYARAQENAEEAFRCSTRPSWPGKSYLAAALAHLGRSAEAERACAELLGMKPDLTAGGLRSQTIHLCIDQDCMDDWLDGLRKAGLPA